MGTHLCLELGEGEKVKGSEEEELHRCRYKLALQQALPQWLWEGLNSGSWDHQQLPGLSARVRTAIVNILLSGNPNNG